MTFNVVQIIQITKADLSDPAAIDTAILYEGQSVLYLLAPSAINAGYRFDAEDPIKLKSVTGHKLLPPISDMLGYATLNETSALLVTLLYTVDNEQSWTAQVTLQFSPTDGSNDHRPISIDPQIQNSGPPSVTLLQPAK